MEKSEIQAIIAAQRAFFSTGATHSLNYRLQALRHLKTAIQRHEKTILTALKKDLGKSCFEGYMCEVGMACSELTYMIQHLRSFA
ncbi:MAG: aldehyde dehydrogenase family protein, partial [Oscillospiraceae bacterium]|nr:aldehyde dehydrogenase family protein [Oscillospiraceae bacterium]